MNFTNATLSNSTEIDDSEDDYEYKDQDYWTNYCWNLEFAGPCNIYCWLTKFFVFFTGATLPVYILVIFVLIYYSKELRSSYFKTCISAGIADILYTLSKYCLQILPRYYLYEFFLWNDNLATVCKIGHWGIYYAQIFGVFLMAGNRCTAILMPLGYNRLWSGKKLVTVILLQWLLPVIVIFPMVVALILNIAEIEIERDPWSKFHRYLSWYSCSLSTILYGEEEQKGYQLFAVIFEGFMLAPALVIIHIVMVVKQFKYSKIAPTGRQSSKPKRSELRLAFSGALITLLYILMALTMVLQHFEVDHPFVASSFYYFSDLFTSLNPFLLLLFSKNVRAYFMKTVCFWKEYHVIGESTTKIRGSMVSQHFSRPASAVSAGAGSGIVRKESAGVQSPGEVSVSSRKKSTGQMPEVNG